MTKINEFLKTLDAKTIGAKWCKVDFHFHTPASGKEDYDQTITYEEIIKKLDEKGIDLVFVTDHNEYKGYLKLKEASEAIQSKVKIYPGVELTIEAPSRSESKPIKRAKFHLLALFDTTGNPEHSIHNLITDGNKDPKIMDLPPVERILKRDLGTIVKEVRSLGGIVIPAHLNQKKKPEDSNSIDIVYSDDFFLSFLEEGMFDALETQDPRTAEFFDGKHSEVRNFEITCVRSSDSHNLESIGRRITYVKVEQENFENIKSSLNYRERISFDKFSSDYHKILGVKVYGNYLKEINLALNKGLSAFVGVKGAGKTSVLECIRFCFGLQGSIPNYENYINYILGPNGRVEVLIENKANRKFLLSRSMTGQKDIECYDENNSKLSLQTIFPDHFNLQVKGWSEITNLASDQKLQFSLLDSFQDEKGDKISAIEQLISEHANRVRNEISTLKKNIALLKGIFEEVEKLEYRQLGLKEINKQGVVAVQEQKEKIDYQASYIDNFKKLYTQMNVFNIAMPPVEITNYFNELNSENDKGELHNSDLIKSISNEIGELFENTNKQFLNSLSEYKKTEQVLDKLANEVVKANIEFENEYQKVFTSLSPEDQGILLERSKIAKEKASLSVKKTEMNRIYESIKETAQVIDVNFKEMDTLLFKRASIREEIVVKINGQLDERVKIVYNKFANINTLKSSINFLGENEFDSKIYSNVSNYINSNLNSIREVINKLSSMYTDSFITALASIPMDTISIQMKMAGSYRDASSLSAGQRTTAVLPILLLQDSGPLVLDQPEDNLDNRYIASTIVPMLSKMKNSQQIIITSHSGNLVVSSDVDQLIHMDSDEKNGYVSSSGFICTSHSVATLVALDILDGGKVAVKKRFKKYGLKIDEN